MISNSILSELLAALERHTQSIQAATAAVNSLMLRPVARAARGVDQELDQVRDDLVVQIEEAQRLADRLEHLRQSLSIDQPRSSPL
jgi:hypothetical protein